MTYYPITSTNAITANGIYMITLNKLQLIEFQINDKQ